MPKRILYVVLDWGLGHATRSIPVIQELLKKPVKVIIGSSGDAGHLLHNTFPELEYITLPAYRIRYRSRSMLYNLLIQLPRLSVTLLREYLMVQQLIRNGKIDAIISDSRFSCFSRLIPTVFITHQINLISPHALLHYPINLVNNWFLKRYDTCWIPDRPDHTNLAGILAHPANGISATYIGPLTRLSSITCDKKYDIIAVLSGPEPQRSVLEGLLINQLLKLPYRCLLVRGKPKLLNPPEFRGSNLEILPFLDAENLNAAIAAAEIVVCRSGYSSIMDLFFLGKKAILIPTPGQTEQEYLAKHLSERGYYVFQHQSEVDIAKGMLEIRHTQPPAPEQLREHALLHRAVDTLLKQIDS